MNKDELNILYNIERRLNDIYYAIDHIRNMQRNGLCATPDKCSMACASCVGFDMHKNLCRKGDSPCFNREVHADDFCSHYELTKEVINK